MPSPPSSLRAPFIVSVTGHRDIVETDILKDKVGGQLEDLRDKANLELKESRAKAKLEPKELRAEDCILLSSLAEGADTLAARVAAGASWQVIVPLPLPREDYERDFKESKLEKSKGAALKEFNRLLDSEQCKHFFIGYAPDCTPENTRKDGEFRNRQYAYLGEFLTRHCEVLIALWDGNDALGAGGAGDVVKMQRAGLPGSLIGLRCDGSLLDAPEGGQTIAIWSKRTKHETNGSGIANGKTHGDVEELAHETTGQEETHREERRTEWDEFVRRANDPELETAVKTPKYEPLSLDLANKSPYLSCVRAAFLRADELANRLQAKIDLWFHLIVFVVLAFTVCIAYAGAYGDSQLSIFALVASWILLAGAYFISDRQKKSKTANRQQDYRALAEAWRVAFFWRALGIETPIDTCYLRSQRGELDWIRQALRTADLLWRVPHPYPKPNPQAFQTVFAAWIQSQTKYFDKKVPADCVYLTALRNWSRALLILGLELSALQALIQTLDLHAGFWSSLWQFLLSFASANLLSSPFVPALLLISRMNSWPIATKENTADVRAETQKLTDKRRKLRQQIILQNAAWKFVAIIGSLLGLAAAGAIISGIILSAERVPLLQMLATLCFFAPSLIFVAADYKALPEHVENYKRMSEIFARAEKMLKQIANIPTPQDSSWTDAKVQEKARRVYEELGREALHENGEWLLIHRDRPLDVEA